MDAPQPPDWTTRPAKLAAAIVLGSACIFGLAWSIATRAPSSARAGVPLHDAPDSGADRSVAQGLSSPRPSLSRRINLNTASATELELLPGIGPAMAQRIIADRDSRGRFRSLNDLDRVSGIGPRTIERLRDKVTLE
jgi:competence protein ComEA